MARKIVVPFAEDGDRVAIPDAVQGDGSVSFTQGFGFDYSRPIGSSPAAKNVPRTGTNDLYHVITEILQQFQQQGAPEWYADTAYAQFARVKHEGSYYVALVGATEEEPGTGSEWTIDNVAAQARLNNLSATTDPTVNDDNTDGYEPLSQWINTVSGEIFIAITVATGAAVWQQGTLTVDELGNVALLNANAIGQNLIQSANPSAIRFLRANADNTVSWLSANDFRLGIGASPKKIPVNDSSALVTLIDAIEGAFYVRLTLSTAKDILVPDSGLTVANGTWTFRNIGAAEASISLAVGATCNLPAGGSFAVPSGGTVEFQRIGSTYEFDLIGQTVPA